MGTMNSQVNIRWQKVCASEDILPMLGVRALIDDRQIAIFRVHTALYAIDAVDPFSGAAVLSRGIVGDVKGRLVVASPLYKQHFDLETGECLEDASVSVMTYAVREIDGAVEIGY